MLSAHINMGPLQRRHKRLLQSNALIGIGPVKQCPSVPVNGRIRTQTGNSEQPKADVLLRPREPLVIERSVPPIFVHFEQRLVDPLTQGAAIGDGNTVLLRGEDWTNDL